MGISISYPLLNIDSIFPIEHMELVESKFFYSCFVVVICKEFRASTFSSLNSATLLYMDFPFSVNFSISISPVLRIMNLYEIQSKLTPKNSRELKMYVKLFNRQ